VSPRHPEAPNLPPQERHQTNTAILVNPTRNQVLVLMAVRVDLSRDRMETRFQVISDRRNPAATVSTLKRYIVEGGKAGAMAD
jgi:hypothetical protein